MAYHISHIMSLFTPREELEGVMKTAEVLQIRGLSEEKKPASTEAGRAEAAQSLPSLEDKLQRQENKLSLDSR